MWSGRVVMMVLDTALRWLAVPAEATRRVDLDASKSAGPRAATAIERRVGRLSRQSPPAFAPLGSAPSRSGQAQASEGLAFRSDAPYDAAPFFSQEVFMFRTRVVKVLALVLLCAAPAAGQSAIAGLVRDTSGAVLPGVTVEATSPS